MSQEWNVVWKKLRENYTRLNFQSFCDLIGEPATINGTENTYAMEKFILFKTLVESASRLGTFMNKLTESE